MSKSLGFLRVSVTNALDPDGADKVLHVGTSLFTTPEDALEGIPQPHISHGWGYKTAELILNEPAS